MKLVKKKVHLLKSSSINNSKTGPKVQNTPPAAIEFMEKHSSLLLPEQKKSFK
jgi:hypothetical protein